MINSIINTYESENYYMAKNKKNKFIKRIKKIFTRSIFIKVAVFLASSGILLALFSFYGQFCVMESKVDLIDDLSDKISELKTTIDSNKLLLDQEMNSLESDLNSLKSDINAFKNIQDASVVYEPTNITLKTLSTATTNNDTEFLSSPSWNDNDVIAKNPRTGRKYKAKSLRNKKILIPYKENGQDVYFFGQFNKYNHWDGDCIINVYSNKKLFMIMEGRYDNGTLISYKQVNHFKNTSSIKVWGISERRVNGNVNVGETYTYYKTKNKKANFTQKNVEPNDILSILDFEDWLNTPMEGYYYGNTSNGSYNDNTGESYLVKYNKDGTVRTLYYGGFQDGKFEDNTNKAWYIALDKENSTYVYYKGSFSNNSPLETSGNKRENITNKEIYKIIDNMHFNVKIKLYNDENKIS